MRRGGILVRGKIGAGRDELLGKKGRGRRWNAHERRSHEGCAGPYAVLWAVSFFEGEKRRIHESLFSGISCPTLGFSSQLKGEGGKGRSRMQDLLFFIMA